MNPIEVRQKIQELKAERSNVLPTLHVGVTVGLISLAIWALAVWPSVPVAIGSFLLIGLMQYRLVMAVHEATHKTLFHPPWLNECVGKVLCGFLGMNLLLYRKAHLQHHKLELTIAEDIDAHLYRPALETPPGWPRLWVLLTGVAKTTVLKIMRKFSTNPQYGERVLSVPPDWLQLGLIAAAQCLLLFLFARYSHIWMYFTHWALPLVGVAQLMDELRTFIEHGYFYLYTGEGKAIEEFPQTTIDVETGKLSQYLFAPFGFHLHLAHHTLLTVPFYKLPELVPLLKEEHQNYPKPIRMSYPALFWRMIWKETPALVRSPAPCYAE